jgi:flagellar basal-body rod modification protein FlgD
MAGSTSALVGNLKDLTVDTAQRKVTKGDSNLGKDAFLQLLVSQLKNQDPMKPMEDSQFIGQMAQFSALEQMQNLNQTMAASAHFQDLTQASAMIGKYASVVNADGGVITGQVSEIRQANGKTTVVMDGKEYDSTTINRVSATPFDGKTPSVAPPVAPTAAPTTAAKYSTLSVSDAVANKYKLQGMLK